jgi:hypothetical protein
MNGFKEFFIETYDLDLLMEVSTLAQTLKQHQDPELVKLVKGQVRERLVQIPFFSQPMGKKMLDRYMNFFAYQVLQDRSWLEYLQKGLADQQNPRFTLSPTEIKQNAVKRVSGAVGNMWRDVGDYFAAMGDRLASKINNPGYSLRQAEQESTDWHEEMASRERGLPDQEAKTFLTLDHLGKEWKGWKWVDLEKGYCSQEAEAMGHCGNSGAAQGDNIVSLRDPEGYAHLTFIVNDGFLGEAKGRANNKPSEKYHKPILELLKSKHIDAIKGGGYAPENNFDYHDLHDDHKKELDHKPNINDPFNHLLEKYKGDPKKMVGGMNEFFNTTSFEDYDGKNFTLETFKGHTQKRQRQDGKMFDAWVGPYEEIEGASGSWQKEVRVGWLDNMEPQDAYHGMESGELIDALNAENKKRIEEYLKGEVKDFDEYDLDDLIAEDDDIMQALDWAAGDTQSSANEGEASDSVRRQLSDPDENGFYVDFNSDPWALKISLDNVKGLYKEMQDDQTLDDGDVETYINIDYTEPQGGHYGTFDNSWYNENVSERLYEVIG